MFRNNVISFDKMKRKYFPIWIESCMHGCDKSISLASNDNLEIKYIEAGNQAIYIDLAKMTYKFMLDDTNEIISLFKLKYGKNLSTTIGEESIQKLPAQSFDGPQQGTDYTLFKRDG